MPKAASPIRLQDELMQAASITAKRFHRSTAEQVEYWADIGRQASEFIDPDVLLSLSSGLARIHIEPVDYKPVNPAEVFKTLEADRDAKILADNVTDSQVKYQVAEDYPGYLEQIDSKGTSTIGQFDGGIFTPLADMED